MVWRELEGGREGERGWYEGMEGVVWMEGEVSME